MDDHQPKHPLTRRELAFLVKLTSCRNWKGQRELKVKRDDMVGAIMAMRLIGKEVISQKGPDHRRADLDTHLSYDLTVLGKILLEDYEESLAAAPRPLGEPTQAPPGSAEKMLILEARAAEGKELFHPDDREEFDGLAPDLWRRMQFRFARAL